MLNIGWKQLLLGNAPPIFLAETVLRAVLMYTALLVTLRILGKRMNGQISVTELAVMISLGAIVSVPMETPSQGVLPAMVLLFWILVLQRGLGYFSFKSRKFGRVVYGAASTLVRDGVLEMGIMKREGITKNLLFAQLRYNKIGQLGEIDRVYLEENGMFSVFRARSPRPGLSTLPEKDDANIVAQAHEDGRLVCAFCGNPAKEGSGRPDDCPNCGHRKWTQAVI